MQLPQSHLARLTTPCYYYDMALLQQTLSVINREAAKHPAFRVHYAVKANANPRILHLIAAAGLGADCVSGGEVATAVSHGFNPQQVVYAGVGKTDREIRAALDLNIGCFNVESLPELDVIAELAASAGKVAHIAFRVNPNVDAHTHAKITTGLSENKFGIAPQQLVAAIRYAKTLPAIRFEGLHFHIGSQITTMTPFKHLCERINELQDALEAEGISLPSINVGGGLGIDYDAPMAHPIPDFESYFETFATHLKLRPSQLVHFELGRSVVGQCGCLLATTLYVKEGLAKRFVIVDAGFTDLIRPAMYGAHHFTLNLTAETDQRAHDADAASWKADIVGPICESSDVFSTDELLKPTHRGDVIAFLSAGAYGEVMASTYNCRTLPTAYFSDNI